MVLVEPGTPDGFSILRSVRTMLLECCPPEEVQRRKRSNNDDRAENGIRLEGEGDPDQDHWHEECQVIAPFTHNGRCPMSRHKMNYVNQNT